MTRKPTVSTPHVRSTRRPPKPSKVYQTFWHFACERQRIFYARLAQQPPPWTSDHILKRHRFTNAYRASDRVSQYLIRQVIYRSDLPTSPEEVVFRILLFKLFNRIETWELIEQHLEQVTIVRFSSEAIDRILSQARQRGHSLYSPAYIMPSTSILGERIKHRGHLKLLSVMIRDRAFSTLAKAPSLSAVYSTLLSYPTLGPFLAFQFATDINYSEAVHFSEDDFVIAGPGAKDGIRKCFESLGDYAEQDVIRWVADRQQDDPGRFGVEFQPLFGRPLKLIDVQNLFCEVSKYARLAHPDVRGTVDRSRIKQIYRLGPGTPQVFYPPKWGVNERIPPPLRATEHHRRAAPADSQLFTL